MLSIEPTTIKVWTFSMIQNPVQTCVLNCQLHTIGNCAQVKNIIQIKVSKCFTASLIFPYKNEVPQTLIIKFDSNKKQWSTMGPKLHCNKASGTKLACKSALRHGKCIWNTPIASFRSNSLPKDKPKALHPKNCQLAEIKHLKTICTLPNSKPQVHPWGLQVVHCQHMHRSKF